MIYITDKYKRKGCAASAQQRSHQMPLFAAWLAIAALWTALMLWISSPLTIADAVVIIICGTLIGLVFYWVINKWIKY